MHINIPEVPIPTAESLIPPGFVVGDLRREDLGTICLPQVGHTALPEGNSDGGRMSLGIEPVRIEVCPQGTMPEHEATQKSSL